MKESIKKAVETYQCPGCAFGSDCECYEKGYSESCGKHVAGTMCFPAVGTLFLGMPKGFNRPGKCETKIWIYESVSNYGDGPYRLGGKFNIPVWKYLDEHGNTLVRGMCPRTNMTFIVIFIGNHIDEIDCLEITIEDLDEMD